MPERHRSTSCPALMAGGADLTGNTGTELKGDGSSVAGEAGRSPDPLRHPRARHGRHPERAWRPRRRAPGRRHVLRVQRLHAPRGPAGGAVARRTSSSSWTHDSVGLGRGRAHTPADRAPRVVARDAAAARDPPGRRQRDGAGVAHRDRLRRPHRAVLTRQAVPVLEGTAGNDEVLRGAYVLVDAPRRQPQLVLIGTGSEVSVCVEAAATAHSRRHRRARGLDAVVGPLRSADRMSTATPCFRRRCPACRSRPASPLGWERYADDIVGIDRFGASAPGRGRARQARLQRRRTWSSRPVRCSERTTGMTKLASTLRRAGPEPLARQPQARAISRAASWPRWSNDGIRGVTSNPTIFQKAIQGSADYDEQFKVLAVDDKPVTDDYWALVIHDINGALDVLRRCTSSSGGRDGFVSVEVVAESRARHRGHDRVRARSPRANRPSQPLREDPGDRGGRAGDQADDRRRPQHQRDADLQPGSLRGCDGGVHLRPRGMHGRPVPTVASVGSFFISRVDTEVDRRLDAVGTPEALAHRGKAAVAQGKLAYKLFEETFAGARWEALEGRGARVQRPLWASTSTKNPAYPDTLYVDELIGPDTVNTMPEPDHRAVRGPRHHRPHDRRPTRRGAGELGCPGLLRDRRRRCRQGARGRGPGELRQVVRRAPLRAPSESGRDRRTDLTRRADSVRP